MVAGGGGGEEDVVVAAFRSLDLGNLVAERIGFWGERKIGVWRGR